MVGAAEAAYHLRRGEWMHRTLCRPRNFLLGGLLLALLVSGRPESLNAQIPGTSGSSLTVPIGGAVPLQMSTKKAIALVKNSKEDVLGVKTVAGDPKRVILIGLAAGVTHIELTDVDGKVDSYDVTVQLDVEFLRTQLHRAFPTANVEPVPIRHQRRLSRRNGQSHRRRRRDPARGPSRRGRRTDCQPPPRRRCAAGAAMRDRGPGAAQ